jgi:hypothetical protein
MTFNQITGRFKGWVTRKLKASGEDLTYQQLIGIINKKQKSKRLEEAKRILVEDLKFDANSGTVTKLDIDEHGDVGYHDKKDKEEAQDAVCIECFEIPAGTKVSRRAIKSWIKAKGIKVTDLDRSTDLMSRRDASTTRNVWEKDEDILNRLSFAIVEVFERDGYKMPTNNKHYEKEASKRIRGEQVKNNPDFKINFEGKEFSWDKGQV